MTTTNRITTRTMIPDTLTQRGMPPVSGERDGSTTRMSFPVGPGGRLNGRFIRAPDPGPGHPQVIAPADLLEAAGDALFEPVQALLVGGLGA
jgi:hypothetical protein